MGTGSVIVGGLGLVAMALMPWMGITAMAVGGACAVIALVLGIASRGSGAGKAGLALGAIGLIGGVGFVFLFSARSDVSAAVVVPSSTPAAVAPQK